MTGDLIRTHFIVIEKAKQKKKEQQAKSTFFAPIRAQFTEEIEAIGTNKVDRDGDTQ